MPTKPLGRRTPQDFEHVEKYPLMALPFKDQPASVPVVIGSNWYTDFDSPVRVRSASGAYIYLIGRDVDHLGTVRGGHCYAGKPPKTGDSTAWWDFYNQGAEGACTGFGSSRMMTLLNRKKYDAWWTYHEAQLADEFPDTPPGEGSTVRAALSVIKAKGLCVSRAGKDSGPFLAEGISAYRWATEAGEVAAVMGIPSDSELVPIVNSWGRDYPHVVHMPLTTLQRLIDEEGEVGLVTDR